MKLPIILVSITIFIFTLVLQLWKPTVFQRFFGELSPVLLIMGSILITSVFLHKIKFDVWAKKSTGIKQSISLAGIFGVTIITFDCFIHFPIDINTPLPYSLLFYPVMGYFVQGVFQLLPLGILLIGLSPVKRNTENNNYILLILMVSFIEAIYQAVSLCDRDQYSIHIIILVGFHVYLFVVVQLLLLKKYGYLAMFSFRMTYYVIWHIIWGSIRIFILFGSNFV